MQRTPRGTANKIRSMLAESHVVSSSRAPAFIPGWVLGSGMVLVLLPESGDRKAR